MAVVQAEDCCVDADVPITLPLHGWLTNITNPVG
jgi:hypothetical protein